MAYVKRHAIHKTLLKALEYIENNEKTDEKILISSNKCNNNEIMAINEMRILKRIHEKEDGIQGFHFVQSFKPNEIEKEKAHQVGKEWAAKFLDDNYQYILTTHIDRGHIHNHIIINSVGLDGKKYHSCKNELNDIRTYSDLVCKENDLSIIEPSEKGQSKNKSYKEWQESNNKNSWKDTVRNDIDEAILSSASFEDFIQNMNDKNYYVKYENVKYITFKNNDIDKAVRGKTLGYDYTEEKIREKIKYKDLKIEKLRGKKYYRTTKVNWYEEINKIKNKNSSLSINIILIIMLLKTIFNKNELSSERKLRPTKYDYVQRKARKGIEDLTKRLNLLNKYKISERGDVEKEKEKFKIKLKDEETKYLKLRNVELKANTVCTEIEMYNKYKTYYQEYEKSFLKGAYRKKHEYELEKFESCKKRLEKFGLENEEDYDNFLNNHKEILKTIKNAQSKINKVCNEIDDLENLQGYLTLKKREKFIKEITLVTPKVKEIEKEK